MRIKSQFKQRLELYKIKFKQEFKEEILLILYFKTEAIAKDI